jgi:hypothetical protein
LLTFHFVPGSLMKLFSTTCQIVILMGAFSLLMKMFLDFGYQNLVIDVFVTSGFVVCCLKHLG